MLELSHGLPPCRASAQLAKDVSFGVLEEDILVFESWLCHLLAVGLGANYKHCFCSGLLICTVEILTHLAVMSMHNIYIYVMLSEGVMCRNDA